MTQSTQSIQSLDNNQEECTLQPFEMAQMAANLADGKKATDIVLLDTGKVSYLADYFVICSAESKTQVRTLTDEIEKAFKKLGLLPIGEERDQDFKWCLLDYGDIVVHIMNKSERQYYQLEHFWNHANPIAPERWLYPSQQAS